MEEISRMREALEILESYNPIRSDYDAYLLEVTQWGLGKVKKPNPKDYGVVGK